MYTRYLLVPNLVHTSGKRAPFHILPSYKVHNRLFFVQRDLFFKWSMSPVETYMYSECLRTIKPRKVK